MAVTELQKNDIRSRIQKRELLAQVAEEAVELSLAAMDISDATDGTHLAKASAKLAHSALKLRRALSYDNPTPISTEEAMWKVQEEVADVLLCLDLLGIDITDANIDLIQEEKATRWIHRLKGECEC